MRKNSEGVFIWRRASRLGRASPLCRDPASHLNSLSKFIFVYMREEPAGPTHGKVCLGQHFLDNFSFHELCLFMCRI